MFGDDWHSGVGMTWVIWNGPPIRLVVARATQDTTPDEVTAFIEHKQENVSEDLPTLILVQRAPAITLQIEIEQLESVLGNLKKKALGEQIAREAR